MTENYTDIPVVQSVTGAVTVPGSKSITNRALVLGALAKGTTVLTNALKSVDTEVAGNCLKQLGVNLIRRGKTITVINNQKKFKSVNEPLYVENAGTTARFIVPVLLAGQGIYILDGNSRMRQRPISNLVEGLRSIGSNIQYTECEGFLPLRIKADGYPGGQITISGKSSSQYISALMLAAPLAKNDVIIRIHDKLVSRTYVEMTANIMRAFGLSVDFNANIITIPAGQNVLAHDYTIEADASSASYFFAVAAITGGKVTVKNISKQSIQGDIGVLDILEKMGCWVKYGKNSITVTGGALNGVDVNMNTMSDVAPTIAVVALFAKGITRIYDVENMRIKECDRISALYTEITKTGAVINEEQSSLTIHGGTVRHGAAFHTYDDHRMAMSLSLIGLKTPGVKILDPDCVTKTFPDYFKKLFRLIL